MKQVFFEAEITNVIDESPNTRRFIFKPLHDKPFLFTPGQFVTFSLPLDSKPALRSYSIASAPADNHSFELLIVLKPDGSGTSYIWDNFVKGATVPVSGPSGKFKLPDKIETDMCFIATGTGVAPFRSMIQQLLKSKERHKHIYLVFGSRTIQDILYKTEFEKYQEELQGFTFIPVLSRESPNNWLGKLGYVHPVYEELFADKRPALFYLCGWDAMIREARQRIQNMGYSKDSIKFERYG